MFLKEHVRGPVRECQAIVLDILREMRCEELKCIDLYTAIPCHVKRRSIANPFGGRGRTRCLGAQCDTLSVEVLIQPSGNFGVVVVATNGCF